MWALLPVLVAVLLLQTCHAAFVETFKLSSPPTEYYVLDQFIIDVALDTDHKLLKFFINSKVDNASNISSTDPVITDVDFATNRFTTFHVDIDFMGKTIILKDLRFCDMVAVKNTSAFEESPRYPENGTLTSSASTELASATELPKLVWPGFNDSSVARRNDVDDLPRKEEPKLHTGLMSTTNSSVEAIFSNSTGTLVQCPLYQNDSIIMYYQADISDHFNRLGSYTVSFTVISNGELSNIIGGARAYVTPVLQPRVYNSVLFFGMLCLLLATNCINYFIVIMSPNQESWNPFLIEASTICNESLLKQLEASINRIFGYFQYALFMAALDLQYPGFLQPLMGQIRWCALMGINMLNRQTSIPKLESDNVYITLHSSGLGSLALYSSSRFVYYSWPNFMLCLLSWIGITMVIYQGFIMFMLLKKKLGKNSSKSRRNSSNFTGTFNGHSSRINFQYSVSKNAWALLGHVLRQFLSTFGVPFLVLTLFMLYTSGNLNGKRLYFSQDHLRLNAFNTTVPYDYITSKLPLSAKAPEYVGGHKRFLAQIPTGSLVAGCISLFAWLALIVFFISKYLLVIKKGKLKASPKLRLLYTSVKTVIVWSYFYNEYQPEKVIYAAVDIVYVVLILIVIGLLQMLGTVQVVLLIMIEFVQLLLLLFIRPFYLRMRWHSLAWLMPAARLLVAILCIPYIRPLSVSEASRTYVAYAQLIIHLLVAFVFVGHLFYCLALMGASFAKEKKDRKRLSQSVGANNGPSVDDFNDDFEYKPVDWKPKPELPRDDGETALTPQSTGDDEVNYYRTHTEMILQRTQLSRPTKAESYNVSGDEERGTEDSRSEEAERTQKDYTTREGDGIYNKFFSGGEVDPEIRELWLSRDWKSDGPSGLASSHQPEKKPNKISGFFENLNVFRAKLSSEKPKAKGFEVSRPRPIVVRPTNQTEKMDLSTILSD